MHSPDPSDEAPPHLASSLLVGGFALALTAATLLDPAQPGSPAAIVASNPVWLEARAALQSGVSTLLPGLADRVDLLRQAPVDRSGYVDLGRTSTLPDQVDLHSQWASTLWLVHDLVLIAAGIAIAAGLVLAHHSTSGRRRRVAGQTMGAIPFTLAVFGVPMAVLPTDAIPWGHPDGMGAGVLALLSAWSGWQLRATRTRGEPSYSSRLRVMRASPAGQ